MIRQLGHPGVYKQFLDELPMLVRYVFLKRLLPHPAGCSTHIV